MNIQAPYCKPLFGSNLLVDKKLRQAATSRKSKSADFSLGWSDYTDGRPIYLDDVINDLVRLVMYIYVHCNKS